MSEQPRRKLGMDSLARSMDDTIDGIPAAAADAEHAADERDAGGDQLVVREHVREAYTADDEPDDQPS